MAETIRATATSRFIPTEEDHRGWCLLYSQATRLADYCHPLPLSFASLDTRDSHAMCPVAAVDQHPCARHTAQVFFEILLPRYGMIISGRQQIG